MYRYMSDTPGKKSNVRLIVAIIIFTGVILAIIGYFAGLFDTVTPSTDSGTENDKKTDKSTIDSLIQLQNKLEKSTEALKEVCVKMNIPEIDCASTAHVTWCSYSKTKEILDIWTDYNTKYNSQCSSAAKTDLTNILTIIRNQAEIVKNELKDELKDPLRVYDVRFKVYMGNDMGDDFWYSTRSTSGETNDEKQVSGDFYGCDTLCIGEDYVVGNSTMDHINNGDRLYTCWPRRSTEARYVNEDSNCKPLFPEKQNGMKLNDARYYLKKIEFYTKSGDNYDINKIEFSFKVYYLKIDSLSSVNELEIIKSIQESEGGFDATNIKEIIKNEYINWSWISSETETLTLESPDNGNDLYSDIDDDDKVKLDGLSSSFCNKLNYYVDANFGDISKLATFYAISNNDWVSTGTTLNLTKKVTC